MKITRDTATTVLGGIGAVVTAVEPVMAASSGTMHQQDYIQLAMAAIMALFGWFTNKKEKTVEPEG